MAHDGEANLSGAVSFVSSVNIGNKTTAGSNRLAVLHYGVARETGTTTIGTHTYAGSNVTQAGTGASKVVSIETFDAKLYYFVAPATTGSAVVFNWSASGDVRGAARRPVRWGGRHAGEVIDVGVAAALRLVPSQIL